MLKLLIEWLCSSVPTDNTVYADLDVVDVFPINDLLNNYRPDIAIVGKKVIRALELTVP